MSEALLRPSARNTLIFFLVFVLGFVTCGGQKAMLFETPTSSTAIKRLSSIFSAQEKDKECQIDELEASIQKAFTILP